MKRNAVGLATICILSTMVLVMVSGTAMVVGSRSRIRERMIRDAEIAFSDVYTQEEARALEESLRRQTAAGGIPAKDLLSFRRRMMWVYLNEARDQGFDRRVITPGAPPMMLAHFALIPLEDYNRVMGEARRLAPGEALSYSPPESPLPERFAILGNACRVKARLETPQPLAFYAEEDNNYLLVMGKRTWRASSPPGRKGSTSRRRRAPGGAIRTLTRPGRRSCGRRRSIPWSAPLIRAPLARRKRIRS